MPTIKNGSFDFDPGALEEAASMGVLKLGPCTILFDAEITAESANEFISVLVDTRQELRTNAMVTDPEIQVLMSSLGGDVHAAMRMYDMIHNSVVPVKMYGTGMVASAGLLVYLASDFRYAYSNTIFLHHQISGGASGTMTQLMGFNDHIIRLTEQFDQLIIERTNMTKDILHSIRKDEHYFAVDKAIEYGIVHEIALAPVL